MASENGIKLVSTLVFPDITQMRYEIFQGTKTSTMWGFYVYMLKSVDVYKSDLPVSMKRTGATITHKAETWVFIKGVSCENVTTLIQAEEFVEDYHEKNRLMLSSYFNAL
ncbi:hypothetical protein FCG88_005500 [Klebsiella pneumoniae]|uniref:hypothetical protein n=1 Tax=Klebsiella pneumoniae complex TaxID=3390273 RepID=UPI0010911B3F|nr:MULTISPECIES: hypothetical protein [Klebsiella]MCW9275746.1 hypothetical protein [Klebsiella variicola]TYY37094.1 hypothetical protein FCG88_005500 [Klebsiella pneumoniae]VGH91083.1 Uncharacterised protein [Klebsiella pneumoniae]HCC2859071.1 hypothetical protein [Klebsiella variicola]HDK6789155.1 hypothetical protein [Klebsiella variicola]